MENGQIVFAGTTENSILYYLNENIKIEDFKSISGRKGNGKVLFDKVDVFGAQEHSLPQVGVPFTINIQINNIFKISSLDIRVDLRIDDSMGQRILWLSNSLIKMNKYENIQNIQFRINKLNLNHGFYYTTLYMEVESDLSDYIQNAFSFEVIDGDYYGTGRGIPPKQSKLLSDFNVFYK